MAAAIPGRRQAAGIGALGFLGLLLAASTAPAQTATAPATGGPGTSADLRPIFAKHGLDVRPQGSRPTCSVFTMAGALEYALARKENHATRLSIEFLNWASNREAGEVDDGSFFSDLWSGFASYGACAEEVMPYRSSFDPKYEPTPEAHSNARPLKAEGLRMHWIKRWNPNTGLTDAEFAEVKHTLARGWPVAGGFRWPKKGKERYEGPLLVMVGAEDVFDGHSVLLAGYRDDPTHPGGGVFMIRNTGAGPRDGLMSYAYAKAYMNDAVWIDFEKTGSAAGSNLSPRDLLNPMSAAPAGRNRRVSSNERPRWNDGNMDMNWLMPGDSVDMPLLEGPGIITHMWLTSHAGWANELNALALRIYYDGQSEPGVEVPLADFFAVGQGKPAAVESIPVQVSPTGSLSCYWRMPFAKSARIVVTNDNPDRSTGLYWQVDWTQLESLPAGTPYFHAKYRQEYPARMGTDYLLADLEGAGWYAGTVMSVTMAQDGWFGEGDDFFYIDAETEPSLQGTGTEDYFNYAWGFGPRTSHFFGHPRVQGDRTGDSVVCYRWHLPDAVNFERSLKVAIEHKGNSAEDTDYFYLERPDFISSVAFWYQTGSPKSWEPLPPFPQRRVPWEQHHLVRTFQQAEVTGDAKLRVETTGFFGSRPTLVWPNRSAGASLTLPFEMKEEGRYAVRLTAGIGPQNGTYEIRIDGRPVLTHSFRSPQNDEADLLLGTHRLARGRHTLTFKANVERSGPLVLEMLRLLKLPPEVKREVRNDNEAHFVRLGIGRAVYAYRLAYGRLPASLQELVDSGILPERYLNDENHLPLKWKIADGALEVESVGPGQWKHRWQGLDARR